MIDELLESFGLGKTERTVYLSGLRFEEVGVGELLQITGINRTTIYHALSTLKDKGFCAESKSGGKLVYVMTRPEYLLQMISQRQMALETQKHELTELISQFPTPESGLASTTVEKFDGISGVKSAIDKALFARERKWRIIAPRRNIFTSLPKDYSTYFMRTRDERGIQAKTLWEASDIGGSNLDLKQLLMRRPRYLSPELSGQFKATIIQFDDKILFVQSSHDKSAILLQSQEVADTFSVMFDDLWSKSATS